MLDQSRRGACSSIPCQYVDWIVMAFMRASPGERQKIFNCLSGAGYPRKQEKAALIRLVCRLAGSKWGSDDRFIIDCAFRHFKLVLQMAVKAGDNTITLCIPGVNMADYLIMAIQKGSL